MKKAEAIEIIIKNIQDKFEGKYIVDATNKNKIKLKDLNNTNLILYTILIRSDWMMNYIEVSLYNGNLTKMSLFNNFINFAKEDAELELLK